MSRGLLTLVAGISTGLVLAGSVLAVPVSDGSIFEETFTAYPEDPKSAAIGAGASISGGAAQIQTTTGTEGVFRASPLGISSTSEYVVEFDWRLNDQSGDNFYMFYVQDSSAPFVSDIALRAYPQDSSTWNFQVDHASGGTAMTGYNFNQTYHVTIHHKGNVADDIDLYIDVALAGSFIGRNSSLGADLMQWGDSSSGAGFGNATLDNISIGANVPEPMAFGVLGLGAMMLLRRRTA